jgi:uncharacterized protein
MVDYFPPLLHRHTHFSTIIPNQLRFNPRVNYVRQTIQTPDLDFLDLDIASVSSPNCILLLHGLEGSSQSAYIRGMTFHLNQARFDVVVLNFRSCSGRKNNLPISYHSGKTDDVELVCYHLIKQYQSLQIIGFSLGANVLLKMAGEWGNKPPANIKSIVAVSVPCDLASSAEKLKQFQNRIYLWRFLSQLKAKAEQKASQFPESNIDQKALKKTRNFEEFDEVYTAPVHDFDSANDYYSKSSSKQFIESINLPTLIINAKNDSFLTPECNPIEEARSNPFIELWLPTFGGHVGFAADFLMKKPFWHEAHIIPYLINQL